MNTYIKLIDGNPIEAPQNYNGIINYNLCPELMIQDGYKLLVPAIVPPETEIRMYHFDYEEKSSEIDEIVVYDETQEEAEERIKRVDKENKTNEINEKIDELERMSVKEILNNNTSNIEVYKEVINGLEQTKANLIV